MPEINSPESIIVYGGSFNPLHMSHVLVHAALSAYFPLAQKWIVASYSHAFDKLIQNNSDVVGLTAMNLPTDWKDHLSV